MKEVILYFVKYPAPGKVKTRLAESVGPDRAAVLYRDLTAQNLARLRTLAGEGKALRILFDPPDAGALFADWLGGDLEFCPQAGGGLGDRLSEAFRGAFEEGAERVIAVGSDTIGLDAGLVREAFAGLESAEVVIGPSRDGGYYLIGSNQPRPSLFREIPWSTDRVLECTLAVIRRENWSFRLLDSREDLDRAENLKTLFTNDPNRLS
ncbi:MAG: TIGR04282 family arsenosugar biosynthesis glycosyltransferase [Candidatus Omnitrophica bacterium]|nr:TIGR04282 family arsenosugar biosynthesis glycosyltransferase [Candidatus Omnitrophota bacterium]